MVSGCPNRCHKIEPVDELRILGFAKVLVISRPNIKYKKAYLKGSVK
jgi:hypothetical protein